MEARPALLDLSACDAVGLVSRAQVEKAAAALVRMSDRRDTDALHDFRVAVRRLRSLLRAYRPWLGNAASRKVRRRLRDLGAATNAARDAEVQLAWLEGQRATLSRGERSGLNWILKRLRATRRAGYDSVRRHGHDDFEKVTHAVLERLGDAEATATLREVFAPMLRDHVAELESRLTKVHASSDQKAVHAARICAKRLRYLLEPLRTELAAVKDVLRPLKALQEVLGSLHDMHVLDAELATALDEAAMQKAHRLRDLALEGDRPGSVRERRRDERLGLVTLGAQVQTRRNELFAELERRWLQDRAASLVGDARALADAVSPPAIRAVTDDVSLSSIPLLTDAISRSSIPVERERKYLLLGLPAEAREAPVRQIEQGWLPGRTLRERLRRVRDADGERFYRTIKLGSGVERIEIEEETSAEVFAAMWPLTEGCRIEKRRYCVSDGGLTWEIDEFLDRDLVLAEVELDTTDQPVAIPQWLESVMVREVTEDPSYLNLTLARSCEPASSESCSAQKERAARR